MHMRNFPPKSGTPASSWELSPGVVPTTSYSNTITLPLARIGPLAVWEAADARLAELCTEATTAQGSHTPQGPHQPQKQGRLQPTSCSRKLLQTSPKLDGTRPTATESLLQASRRGGREKKGQGPNSSGACNLVGKPAR